MSTAIQLKGLEVIGDDHHRPQITDVTVAASYNWLDALTPTILVPGIPPVWTPPQFPPALSPDSGSRYIDQNTDRNPGSPLESLISAVNTSQPDFEFNAINIVTDRRPIRKLLGFVNGEHGKLEYSPRTDFRFGIEIMKNGTALFTRIEEQTRERFIVNEKRKVQGYREAFENAYTKTSASAQGSTSHHRIVSYKIGGLSFLVRYAVDGYLENRARTLLGVKNTETTGIDDLVDYLKATSLDHPAPTGNNPFNKRVTVLKGGRDIPNLATFELTPSFITCRYRVEFHQRAPRARFNDIEVTDLKPKLVAWEEKNAGTLKKLVEVLKEILEIARAMKKPCTVSYSGEEGAPLMIDEAKEARIPSLSPKLKALFENDTESIARDDEGTNGKAAVEAKNSVSSA
ncbi:MAG: hypothetical protein Q9164_004757 [Protoblastenia rupestris]